MSDTKHTTSVDSAPRSSNGQGPKAGGLKSRSNKRAPKKPRRPKRNVPSDDDWRLSDIDIPKVVDDPDGEYVFALDRVKKSALEGFLCNVALVRVSPEEPSRYFDAYDLNLKTGDRVYVEGGPTDIPGYVVNETCRQMRPELLPRIRNVVNLAKSAEMHVAQKESSPSSEEAMTACKEAIRRRSLPMKLIRCEKSQNGRKLTFHFAAENRVDFRALLKELSQLFELRIELRQVGVRDESRAVGGIGSCGRELCCSSWIRDFSPVTVKMAKTQNLVLNPQKISGMCGRLKCCLAYEQSLYREARRGLPKMGKTVSTPSGDGRVYEIDIPRRLVRVRLGNNETLTVPANLINNPNVQPNVDRSHRAGPDSTQSRNQTRPSNAVTSASQERDSSDDSLEFTVDEALSVLEDRDTELVNVDSDSVQDHHRDAIGKANSDGKSHDNR